VQLLFVGKKGPLSGPFPFAAVSSLKQLRLGCIFTRLKKMEHHERIPNL
jgi:hypothetical protein